MHSRLPDWNVWSPIRTLHPFWGSFRVGGHSLARRFPGNPGDRSRSLAPRFDTYLADGVVAWIEFWPSFPIPQMDYAAMLGRRTELGRPASSIRLRTATPTAASAFCPEKLRARKRGPMMALYRPIAVSTRARCP
jgi:hypothetical protein